MGLARKIGMDLALPHLSSTKSLIFCTDADTVVSNNYIEKIIKYFDTTDIEKNDIILVILCSILINNCLIY